MNRSLPAGGPTSSANRYHLGYGVRFTLRRTVLLEGFLQLLALQQRSVAPASRDERRVRAVLHDVTLVEDDDVICVTYRADAVRRDDRGAPRERAAQPAQDLRLGVRVDGGERVVEQHD